MSDPHVDVPEIPATDPQQVASPIFASDKMLAAILVGTKTTTRYPVKKQPKEAPPISECPFGSKGDRLWVREEWRIGAWDDQTGHIAIDYRADNHCRTEWVKIPSFTTFNRLSSQSVDDAFANGFRMKEGKFHWELGESPCRWRPPIFMPEWASRLTLEITHIDVIRLSSMYMSDAEVGCGLFIEDQERVFWDGLHKKSCMSWLNRPLMWKLEFTLIENGFLHSNV